MKPFRFLVAVLAMIGLAACYTSDAPLVSDDDAATPFQKITFINQEGKPLEFNLEGKAYKSIQDGETSWLRLKPVEGDYYVAQLSGGEEGTDTLQILYAYMRLDGPKGVADLWRMVGTAADVREGLRECKDGICIDDLQAYITYAQEAVSAGTPADMSMKIETE